MLYNLPESGCLKVVYSIYNNGVKVNSIVADLSFIKKYCEKNGYTYEVFQEVHPLDADRETKISEMSDACNAAIVAGLDIQLPNGETEHFGYSERDQINIKEMFDAVIMGATMYPYQSEDGQCRTYTAEEILTIYPALAGNKTGQLTYYHQLKDYINTVETTEEIEAVTYGQPLSGAYLEHYNEMVAVAAAQMQTVISRITSALSV